eukprot:gnl/TRDRNA2_/TRDRNA2_141802_c0_seq1.p3 gnl/TRDRNA2_/TRDRNA2_141802_c0~~gnl/TRDRNA2_/TRDRNA2_141802_c0_seq1.p3  ORF type:complete len:102 (+),score=16.02 gnl/TRDRNA2_/TRDRNA2_141802_c0_seq1:178-483(+)
MALAEAAERHAGDCAVQGLANASWAFAVASRSDTLLFAAVAAATRRRLAGGLREFRLQDLAIVAWAFAAASRMDASLLAALASAAQLCVGDVNAQDLASMV